MRFIHSADLHLDSLFKNKTSMPEQMLEQLKESTFKAFDSLIDKAIQLNVDFILIAGDLYDEEVRSLKAQINLRKGFERLHKYGIQVYISHGNHDYLKGTRYPVSMPDNVHIFTTSQVEKKTFVKGGDYNAAIYGFSYEEREVKERKVEEFKTDGEADFHIAMLHGSLETNTEEDVYAPFSIEERKKKRFDYWALGHIHKRQLLSKDPLIVYPGNIQGRSRKETGEKGCFLVEWENGNWNMEFLALHEFIFDKVTVTCESDQSPNQIEEWLESAKEQVKQAECPVMLEVELLSSSGNAQSWLNSGLFEEWVSVLNESEEQTGQWIWLDKVQVTGRSTWDEEELKKGHHFTGEWIREMESLEEKDMDEWLSALFHHRKASRFLDKLTDEDKQEIKEKAKTLTLEKLMTKKDTLL